MTVHEINQSIESAAKQGGGRVVVPPGEHECRGPIFLRSGVDLHVSRGATIQFSRSFDDYPVVMTEYEGEPTFRCTSPLTGDDLRDVKITGEGIIDGGGDAWRPIKRMKRTPEEWATLLKTGGVLNATGDIWWPTESALRGEAVMKQLRARGTAITLEDVAPIRDFLRPTMLKLSRCTNVVIDGPTFRNSPAWNLHLLLCSGIVIRNVTVLNDWWAQNGDGIDLESCRDALVTDSLVDVGDDAICLKSGKDEAGRRRGVPTENVRVERCEVRHGHGGVVIGSEMSGGVRNVSVRDCTFRGTDIGLRFKTTRGRGGVVENVRAENVVMHDIRNDAISLNAYYTVKSTAPEPVNDGTPLFRDFAFRNIVCHGAGRPLEIHGLPEMPVRDVAIEQSRLVGKRAAMIAEADGVRLDDVELVTDETPGMTCANVSRLETRAFRSVSSR
jgi:polygalacturonase